jgi:prepilin-type N-terminal cleavage/methylation domain-containing protein
MLRRQLNSRGFTLVELMVVVIIVGVLATLGVYGVRKYVFSSKTTEAIHMIGSIKGAEESYRAETFAYLGADGKTEIDSVTLYPQTPGRKKSDWTNASHTDYAKTWGPLGVMSDSPVIFGYAIVAGRSGALKSPPSNCTNVSWGPRGNSNTGPWYIVKAEADQNGDGHFSCFTSCSLSGEIFSAHEDE